MSEWDDRIRKHPVWETMRALGPVIDQAEAREDVDPVALSALERIRAVLTFTGKKTGRSGFLNSWRSGHSIILMALSEVCLQKSARFVQDGGGNHIASAKRAYRQRSDRARVHKLFLLFQKIFEALSRSGTDYRDALESNLRRVDVAHRKSLTELDELRSQIQTAIGGPSTTNL